jgi:DNA-binding LytR/AlgR family response regulator
MRAKRRILFHDLKMDVPVKKEFIERNYDELMYVLYDAPYCQLHFTDKKIVIETSLQHLMENLPEIIFFQCSRSVIININYCKDFRKPEAVIVMRDKTELDLSRRRVKDFNMKRYKPP